MQKHYTPFPYLSSLPILAVVYRFSLPFLPSYRQPTDLPQSTDFYRFFRGSTEFKIFLPIFLLFHVNYALTNVIFMYLWWKVHDKELEFSVFKLSGYL